MSKVREMLALGSFVLFGLCLAATGYWAYQRRDAAAAPPGAVAARAVPEAARTVPVPVPLPRPQIVDGCALSAPIAGDFTVQAFGVYQGHEPAGMQIGNSGHATGTVHVEVHQTEQPVLLV